MRADEQRIDVHLVDEIAKVARQQAEPRKGFHKPRSVGRGLAAKALERLPPLLARGARVYVEDDRAVDAPPGWKRVKAGRAGAVHYCLMERDATGR